MALWPLFRHGKGRRRDKRRPFEHPEHPAPAAPGDPIVLGGRTFRPIGESTVEHDYGFIALVRGMGLTSPSARAHEAPEELALRLLGEIIGSGKAMDALGYLLVPDGTPSEAWTPELGRQTAAFLAKLTRPEDKALVRSLTLSLLHDFFALGLGSWAISQTSSQPTGESMTAGPSPAKTNGGASGAGSSAPSRKATGNERVLSRRGRFAKPSSPTGRD